MAIDADTLSDRPIGPDVFKSAPWTRMERAHLGQAASVPSMLSDNERRLYLWLAEVWATGAGAIVDLGAFAGGSTACLAEGARRARREAPVFAYDRFRASETTGKAILLEAGVEPFEGEDILPLARRFLAPWEPLVTLVSGEIEDTAWDAGPIELLVVDAAKSAQAAIGSPRPSFPI